MPVFKVVVFFALYFYLAYFFKRLKVWRKGLSIAPHSGDLGSMCFEVYFTGGTLRLFV